MSKLIIESKLDKEGNPMNAWKWLFEQKAFKITILLVVLAIGAILTFYEPNNPQSKELVAIDKLKQATQAGIDGDWKTLLQESEDVAGDNTLPDDIRASAFMLIGSYAFKNHRLDIALVSFLIVKKLPGAQLEDKQDAQHMIDIIHKVTGDPSEPDVKIPSKNTEQL